MTDRAQALVTGANGLLGRRVIAELRDAYEVHGVVHSTPQAPVDGVMYHVVDLSEPWSNQSLPARADTIVHLAQSSQFRDFPEAALDIFQVNVSSTARLLDYARRAGAGKFVLASSGGVYGAGPAAFDENSPIVGGIHGLGYYLGSKLCSEVLVQSYADVMDVKILRLFFMYGAAQRRSMLIPRLVDGVQQGRPITLQGENGIRINPVHVCDAAAAVRACLEHPGSQTINIAGPDDLSIRAIAEIIGAHLGKVPQFAVGGGSQSDLLGRNDLMVTMLRRPLKGFRDGVVELLRR